MAQFVIRGEDDMSFVFGPVNSLNSGETAADAVRLFQESHPDAEVLSCTPLNQDLYNEAVENGVTASMVAYIDGTPEYEPISL
jgi:hypothetical protein